MKLAALTSAEGFCNRFYASSFRAASKWPPSSFTLFPSMVKNSVFGDLSVFVFAGGEVFADEI
jgi:hypothetical protein